ncbi:MAG: cbb3-type cytochrome oxidase assembly protein CcoS [Alphaproteobacteria bacterium]|nr:cbb3-type cytochrome oxidase assembly protein CcoS [Alphaproteobacteria bacterium]MBV9694463.1 cbb3-type cytochrome oxidase assembly protein CcoS [Alphaproteobacteria bacterium]
MNGIAVLVAAALAFGLVALAILLWSLGSGQYDDPDGDALRILIDDADD